MFGSIGLRISSFRRSMIYYLTVPYAFERHIQECRRSHTPPHKPQYLSSAHHRLPLTAAPLRTQCWYIQSQILPTLRIQVREPLRMQMRKYRSVSRKLKPQWKWPNHINNSPFQNFAPKNLSTYRQFRIQQQTEWPCLRCPLRQQKRPDRLLSELTRNSAQFPALGSAEKL